MFHLMGNLSRLDWLGTAAARAALPIPVSVCSIFCGSKQWHDCQCMEFLMCAQVFIHDIAHEGCVNTIRESALEVDCGEKSPCHAGGSNLRQYCTSLFSRMLYQLSYPQPHAHLDITVLVDWAYNTKLLTALMLVMVMCHHEPERQVKRLVCYLHSKCHCEDS